MPIGRAGTRTLPTAGNAPNCANGGTKGGGDWGLSSYTPRAPDRRQDLGATPPRLSALPPPPAVQGLGAAELHFPESALPSRASAEGLHFPEGTTFGDRKRRAARPETSGRGREAARAAGGRGRARPAARTPFPGDPARAARAPCGAASGRWRWRRQGRGAAEGAPRDGGPSCGERGGRGGPGPREEGPRGCRALAEGWGRSEEKAAVTFGTPISSALDPPVLPSGQSSNVAPEACPPPGRGSASAGSAPASLRIAALAFGSSNAPCAFRPRASCTCCPSACNILPPILLG